MAEAVESRIKLPIGSGSSFAVSGTTHPQAKAQDDAGPLPGGTQLAAVSLYLKPSSEQQAQLEQLLRDQQDPLSSNYHKWLTPDQYSQRFGVSSPDIARIRAWLEAQGLSVQEIAPNSARISFTGTAGQIEIAFLTHFRRYTFNGQSHFANAEELSVPAVLSEVVLGFGNLSDFRPRPRLMPAPRFTSSISGNHYLAPNDFATIYDLGPIYAKGYTGAGEKIAVVGQSAIKTGDVDAFRSAAGLPVRDPIQLLVPNSGNSTVVSEDETEADLDVQWAGAIARDADIVFVYVGDNANFTVFDALTYVIENDVAPVISVSYGNCEADFGKNTISTMESYFKEAAAQGQTIVAASGDQGAADCEVPAQPKMPIAVATHGLAVEYPASSAYVTGVGGTTLSEGTGTYWGTANDSGNGSALSYIPEGTWNDTSTKAGLAASGGGISILFSKPVWQSGNGVPVDGMRDVPDIALAASPDHDPYLYCSEGSCVDGFRASDNTLTVAGGTSFGAPTFAGIVALLNQAKAAQGLGTINPGLYQAAAATNPAFHDITLGNNEVPCTSGTANCSTGSLGYSAGAGYDLVTGLGTPDVANLVAGFNASAGGASGNTVGGATSGTAGGGKSGGGTFGWLPTLIFSSIIIIRRIILLLSI